MTTLPTVSNNLKCSALGEVCDLLTLEQTDRAAEIALRNYPFLPLENAGRRYSVTSVTALLFRDGFIDRYTGERLVYPPTLRLLSILLPEQFPYHPNWKMDKTHPMYWDLSPTVDHIVPVSRGGLDTESNWVCTSMLTNSRKANWTLEELGWTLFAPGDLSKWDGLSSWFAVYADTHSEVLRSHESLRRWYRALRALTLTPSTAGTDQLNAAERTTERGGASIVSC